MNGEKFTTGFLLFPRLTQLDLTAPYEFLSRIPNSHPLLIAKTLAPVSSDCGLSILPTATFTTAPKLDLICIPGGPGTLDAAADPETIAFVQRAAAQARFITSVCTGSLILGAAGLLQGRRATSHWAYRDLLEKFGAIPTQARVVEDGNIITGGGVTAGIDFALTLLARIAGAHEAQLVQLALEYDPSPPFTAGTPETAPPEVLKDYQTRIAKLRARREQQVNGLTS